MDILRVRAGVLFRARAGVLFRARVGVLSRAGAAGWPWVPVVHACCPPRPPK